MTDELFSALAGPTAVFAARRGDFSLLANRVESHSGLGDDERKAIAAILRGTFVVDRAADRKEQTRRKHLEIAAYAYLLMISGRSRKYAELTAAKDFKVSIRTVANAIKAFDERTDFEKRSAFRIAYAMGNAAAAETLQVHEKHSAVES